MWASLSFISSSYTLEYSEKKSLIWSELSCYSFIILSCSTSLLRDLMVYCNEIFSSINFLRLDSLKSIELLYCYYFNSKNEFLISLNLFFSKTSYRFKLNFSNLILSITYSPSLTYLSTSFESLYVLRVLIHFSSSPIFSFYLSISSLKDEFSQDSLSNSNFETVLGNFGSIFKAFIFLEAESYDKRQLTFSFSSCNTSEF